MEIQKVFSDPQGEERLYSVLLSGEELRLFASAQAKINKANKNWWFANQSGRPGDDFAHFGRSTNMTKRAVGVGRNNVAADFRNSLSKGDINSVINSKGMSSRVGESVSSRVDIGGIPKRIAPKDIYDGKFGNKLVERNLGSHIKDIKSIPRNFRKPNATALVKRTAKLVK